MSTSFLEQKHDSFSTRVRDHAVIIHFPKNPLLYFSSNLSQREKLRKYLEVLSGIESIQVVVMYGPPEKKGREEYLDFFKKVRCTRFNNVEILRLCNTSNELILSIADLDKIVVAVNTGCVTLHNLSISLAADYRIITRDTVFERAYPHLGLIPKGGGPFFMSRMLGLNRAREFFLSDRDITALDALRLGLVDRVVDEEKLESVVDETIAKYGQVIAPCWSGIKRLLNYTLKDLHEYLEFENKEILRVVGRADFSKKQVG